MHKPSAELPDPQVEPFVNVDRAAAVIGVAPGSIYRMASSGQIETVRVGRLIRVPTSELHRLAGTTRSATPSTSSAATAR